MIDVLLDGLDGAAVALFGIAGATKVLLELVVLAGGASAGTGTDGAGTADGLDAAAGIVNKWRITFREATAFWQQGYLPPQAISPQCELFQCRSSIEYPWVFKM